MDKERKEKADIDPALLEPIGLVTVNFAMLEESLSLCIWKLIGAEGRVGQIVTAHTLNGQLRMSLAQVDGLRLWLGQRGGYNIRLRRLQRPMSIA